MKGEFLDQIFTQVEIVDDDNPAGGEFSTSSAWDDNELSSLNFWRCVFVLHERLFLYIKISESSTFTGHHERTFLINFTRQSCCYATWMFIIIGE